MKTSSFGALTITPRVFASSSAKQYSSPVCFPVLHESSRMFCLFQPSIWRMTDASKRGDILGSFVPYPTAVGDPCIATSKNVFNGFTALIFTASWSSSGKAAKPFSKRIYYTAGCYFIQVISGVCAEEFRRLRVIRGGQSCSS